MLHIIVIIFIFIALALLKLSCPAGAAQVLLSATIFAIALQLLQELRILMVLVGKEPMAHHA